MAQAFFSGQGPVHTRPFIRFWNGLSYRRWLTLEDSLRLGQETSGEFNFTAGEQKIFSGGMEAFSAETRSSRGGGLRFQPPSPRVDLGEFLVGGNGDVYSIEEVGSWLDGTGWRFVEHKELGGPASLVIADAA